MEYAGKKRTTFLQQTRGVLATATQLLESGEGDLLSSVGETSLKRFKTNESKNCTSEASA